jgi:hypothetical protein
VNFVVAGMATKASKRDFGETQSIGTEDSIEESMSEMRQLAYEMIFKVNKMELLLKRDKPDPWDTFENKKVQGKRTIKLFKLHEKEHILESLTLETQEGVVEAEKLGWKVKGEITSLEIFGQAFPEAIACDLELLAVAERNRKFIGKDAVGEDITKGEGDEAKAFLDIYAKTRAEMMPDVKDEMHFPENQ